MLSTIMSYFFFACILFFLGVIFYIHYINKRLDIKQKECYNDDTEEKDKVSPNQR